jgi:hypothetical protein
MQQKTAISQGSLSRTLLTFLRQQPLSEGGYFQEGGRPVFAVSFWGCIALIVLTNTAHRTCSSLQRSALPSGMVS